MTSGLRCLARKKILTRCNAIWARLALPLPQVTRSALAELPNFSCQEFLPISLKPSAVGLSTLSFVIGGLWTSCTFACRKFLAFRACLAFLPGLGVPSFMALGEGPSSSPWHTPGLRISLTNFPTRLSVAPAHLREGLSSLLPKLHPVPFLQVLSVTPEPEKCFLVRHGLPTPSQAGKRQWAEYC